MKAGKIVWFPLDLPILLDFTYWEINPTVFSEDDQVVPLDVDAKTDVTDAFRYATTQWGHWPDVSMHVT